MNTDRTDLTIFFDFGDADLSKAKNPFAEIEKSISRLLRNKNKPIALGGDHSITFPILKSFNKYFPRIDILHFDAHPDLCDEFQGNKFSHACPFARIMENGLVQRLVQIGIRTCNVIQKLKAPVIIGADLVEFNPKTDSTGITAVTCSKILKEIAGKILLLDPAE